MKKALVLLITVVVTLHSYAQKDSTIKRLQKELDATKTVTSKIDKLFEIATEYNLENPTACQETIDKAIYMAEESRDREMMVKARRLACSLYNQASGIKACKKKKYCVI
jgi:hypothetical protein